MREGNLTAKIEPDRGYAGQRKESLLRVQQRQPYQERQRSHRPCCIQRNAQPPVHCSPNLLCRAWLQDTLGPPARVLAV